jgi:hypothetical protein
LNAGWKLSLDSINLLYQPASIIKNEGDVLEDQVSLAYYEIQVASQNLPTAFDEYLWLESLVELVNMLAKKWGTANIVNYKHRGFLANLKDSYMMHQITDLRS